MDLGNGDEEYEEDEGVRIAGSECGDEEGEGAKVAESGNAEAGGSSSISGRIAKGRLSSIGRMADKPSQ